MLECPWERAQRVVTLGSRAPAFGMGRRNLHDQRVAERSLRAFIERLGTRIVGDVAPSFYPATIGVWSSVMPCWAVVAAVRGAKPSVGRSAADRRAAA